MPPMFSSRGRSYWSAFDHLESLSVTVRTRMSYRCYAYIGMTITFLAQCPRLNALNKKPLEWGEASLILHVSGGSRSWVRIVMQSEYNIHTEPVIAVKNSKWETSLNPLIQAHKRYRQRQLRPCVGITLPVGFLGDIGLCNDVFATNSQVKMEGANEHEENRLHPEIRELHQYGSS